MTGSNPPFGSAPISDTGVSVPRGISMRLFSLADSTGLQVASSTWVIPAALSPPDGAGPVQTAQPERGNGHDQPAGVGHNSGARPMPEKESGKHAKAAAIAESQIRKDAWYTPSKQTLDEAAAANAGPGRHLHRQRALIAAIFDSRLGDTPIAVKLLAAVIDCSNSQTGTAFPGNERLALEIYIDLQRLPPEAREDALQRAIASVKNFATLLGQCGYMVTQRRAPPGGGRAVAHRAVTHPDREEMLAAIEIHERWQEQENARKADAKKRTDQGHAAHDLSYGNGSRDLRTDGYGHAAHDPKAAEVTRRQELRSRADTKNGPPLSITEPGSLLNPLPGADAPGVCATEDLFSGDIPDQGGAPPDGVAPAAKGGSCKPSPGKRAAPRLKATEEHFARFWDAYPKREGKAKARERFLALSRDDAEHAVAAAKAYADDCRRKGTEPRFIKWPEGWLSARRFEDYAPAHTSAADPDAALKALVASPFGRRTLEREGHEEGMKILRARLAANTGTASDA